MAYFPNGSTGDKAQEDYCYRCVHWDEETWCPVWDLHVTAVGDVPRMVLNTLWPMSPGGVYHGECGMFHAKEATR